MKILVLCDDVWHPAGIVRAGLAPLEKTGFSFEWMANAGEWSEAKMAAFPVTILTKSNNISSADQTPWMTGEVEEAFHQYLSDGNGLVVIHSGSAGYQDNPSLRRTLGGLFESHPEQCPVTVEALPNHPLGAGSAAFTLLDEHYMMHLEDPRADVFLTTTSEHGSQPGGWTRREGAGRVVVLTPGHNLEVWLHPSYQRLIRNALEWCGKFAR
jgi:uncharacterized protein